MRYVSRRRLPPRRSNGRSFDGLAPDGSLYVPETIDRLTAEELARLPSRSLTEIGIRVAAAVHRRRDSTRPRLRRSSATR